MQQAREEAAALRLAMAQARATEVERKRAEREARLDHQESQLGDAEDRTEEVAAKVLAISTLLGLAVTATWALDFGSLRHPAEIPPFDPQGADIPGPITQLASFLPPKLSFLEGLVPGAKQRHQAKVAAAHTTYERAMGECTQAEGARRERLAALRSVHDALRARYGGDGGRGGRGDCRV